MTIFESYNVPNNGPLFATISIVMVSLATAFVMTRVAGRVARSGSSPGWDDACVVVALGCCIICTVIGCLGIAVSHGFGRHGRDLSAKDLQDALKFFYAYQIVYKFLIMFTKLSFLVLFLRLFPDKLLRLSTWAMIGFTTLGSVVFGLATIVQCRPLEKAWQKSLPGACFNQTGFWYSHAAFNTFTDLIIFFMPVHQILKLQLPFTQKMGLILIFATGAFVLFTSIMRMIALDGSSKASDPTCMCRHPTAEAVTLTFGPGGSMTALMWTEIEANTGVIVACLPTLRAPIADVYHHFFPVVKRPSPSSSNNSYSMKTISTRRVAPAGCTCLGQGDMEQKRDGLAALLERGDAEKHRDSQERIIKTTDISVDFDFNRFQEREGHSRGGLDDVV